MSSKKIASQKPNKERDVREYLKLLRSGDIHLINVEKLKKESISNPQLGDHIQYELHNYCKNETKSKTDDVSVVVKLAELCFSPGSVAEFTNIDRFLGCVYYISSYFLEKERYESALKVTNSLFLKKKEISNAFIKKPDLGNFIGCLHNSLMKTAIVLATKFKRDTEKNYKIVNNIAVASIKIVSLITTENVEMAKKILRTSKSYLHSFKQLEEKNVAHFFNVLQEVLKILLPVFSPLDYAFFYLYRIDQVIKNWENTAKENLETQFQLNTIINVVSTMLNLSSVTRSTFNYFLEFFFNPLQNDVSLDVQVLDDLLAVDLRSDLYFIILSHIFNHGIQFWWKKYEENLWEKVSLNLLKKLFQKMMAFHEKYSGLATFYCSSPSTPYEICFGDLLTGNLQKIQYTIRLYLKNKITEDCLTLVPIARKSFKLSIECLDVMEARGCCQKQRSCCWKLSIIHHMNMVEDIFRHSSFHDIWQYIKDCSHEILREIVNTSFELPFDFKRVNNLFKRWHFANLKLKQFQECLYVCLAYFVSYPEKETEVMSMWLQTKAESCNEIVQEVTASKILKTWDSSIKEFNKKYTSSRINLKSALLMELKAYTFCSWNTFEDPKSRYNLTLQIWNQVQKFPLSIWETSFALLSLISMKICVDQKLPQSVFEKCDDLLQELHNWKVDGKYQCRSLLHAANLTFALFLLKIRELENCEGNAESYQLVVDYLKKAEEENIKFGGDVDLNISCDVIPTSNRLTIELETKHLNSLDKVVEIWERALDSDLDAMPEKLEVKMCLQTMKHIAQLYELMGEYQRSLYIWVLIYKGAKLCSDSATMLLGLSRLIEHVMNVDESALVEETEKLSEELNSENKEKYVLVEYWLATASNYLKNKNQNKCLENLLKAKKTAESLGSTIRSSALKARFWCLVSQFLCVYPNYETEFGYPDNTDLRIMVLKGFEYANAACRGDLIKSVAQGECLELILAMLSVNVWAFYFYGVYRLTNYMRMSLNDIYQIVQKLGLPTRTAEMLLRLAEVDIIKEKAVESKGKLTKLKIILTTFSSKCEENLKIQKRIPSFSRLEEKPESEKQRRKLLSPTRFLEENKVEKINFSPMLLYLPDVKPSESPNHLNTCKCRLCKNIFIQLLSMNTLVVEAEIHRLEGDQKRADVLYTQARDAMDALERRRTNQNEALQDKIENFLNMKIGKLDLFGKTSLFNFARVLIRSCFFEIFYRGTFTPNLGAALKKTDEIMNNLTYEEKLLKWTFTELRLITLETIKSSKEETSKKLDASKSPVSTFPSIPSTLLRTPLVVPSGSFQPSQPTPVVTESLCNDFQNIALIGEDELHKMKKKSEVCLENSFNEKEIPTVTKTAVKIVERKMSSIVSRKLEFDEPEDSTEQKMTVERKPAASTRRKVYKAAPKKAKGPKDVVEKGKKVKVEKS